MMSGLAFISLPPKKLSKESALYKLLVSFAMPLKRGEKFFRLSLLQQQDSGAA